MCLEDCVFPNMRFYALYEKQRYVKKSKTKGKTTIYHNINAKEKVINNFFA